MTHFWAAWVAEWVAHGIWGDQRRFGTNHAIGFANAQGEHVAGVVYHEYSPQHSHIEISGFATTPRWLTRTTIDTIFEYPFGELGLRMVVARHSEHNHRARRIWRALGATEHVLPDMIADGHAEVVSILKRENFEESRYG